MRVGIICEGSTDFVVLRAIAAEVLRSRHPTFALLQPDFDRLVRPSGARRPATGWQAVRAFLQAGNVEMALLDLVIVQVDASIRRLAEVARRLPDDELDALCEHVKEWMGGPVPSSVIITLPREELETWLLAAHTHRKKIEAIADPAGAMVAVQLLDMRRGKPDKNVKRYEELLVALRSRLFDQRWMRRVPELERLCTKLRGHGRRAGRASSSR